MKTKAQVEEEKERRYKQFFSEYEDNLKNRMENHLQNVTQ